AQYSNPPRHANVAHTTELPFPARLPPQVAPTGRRSTSASPGSIVRPFQLPDRGPLKAEHADCNAISPEQTREPRDPAPACHGDILRCPAARLRGAQTIPHSEIPGQKRARCPFAAESRRYPGCEAWYFSGRAVNCPIPQRSLCYRKAERE